MELKVKIVFVLGLKFLAVTATSYPSIFTSFHLFFISLEGQPASPWPQSPLLLLPSLSSYPGGPHRLGPSFRENATQGRKGPSWPSNKCKFSGMIILIRASLFFI